MGALAKIREYKDDCFNGKNPEKIDWDKYIEESE